MKSLKVEYFREKEQGTDLNMMAKIKIVKGNLCTDEVIEMCVAVRGF